MLVPLSYIGVLITNCLIIVFILRQKGSYFRDVKLYFCAAYVGFGILFLLWSLSPLTQSETGASYSTRIGVSAAVFIVSVMSFSVGVLYERLSDSRKRSHTHTILRYPFALTNYAFLLIVLILTWSLAPFQIAPVRTVSGDLMYLPNFEPWYMACLVAVLSFLLAYPCLLLLILSRRAKTRKVAKALWGFGVCWASVGISMFGFDVVLRSMGFDVVWLGNLISTMFLGVTAYLFKETTIFESFQVGPYSSIGLIQEGEVAIVTYTSAADKMKVFSAFIREGIESGDWIRYIYPDEETGTVRGKLEEYGIDVEKYERNGTLSMKSLTEYYLPNGRFDPENLIQSLLNRREEVRRRGYKHTRELVDVGDFSFLKGQWRRYIVDYWDDPRWGPPSGSGLGVLYEPFIIELTAINVGAISEMQATEILKTFGGGKCPPTRFIDFLEYADAFSKEIGILHQKLLGRKFLLEFDPASNYEKVVDRLTRESVANVEPVFVFTSRASPIHKHLAEQPAIKFFLTSISTSTPESISENKVLLPARNVPLILAAIDKVLETHADMNVCFVFDILSDLLTTVGREQTFTFLRHALDMLYSKKTYSLFLLNTRAHEPKVVSHIRDAFLDLLTYDEAGLEAMKIS